MERIIRSYIVGTFNQSGNSMVRNNKSHLGYNPPPKKVSICGAVETNINTIAKNQPTAISTTQQTEFNNQSNCSQSLQMLLDKRPSMLVYLVFLASTCFLTALMIWLWKGKIVEVARIQNILFSPVTLEKYKSVNKDKFSSLNLPENKQIKLGKLIPDHVVNFFQKDMPIQIEVGTTQMMKSGIIYGEINSIFPDTESNNQNIFFYQIEVASQRIYPMNKSQYIALSTEQKITTKMKRYYSISEIFAAKIN